jgi:hypothetical protein
MIGHFRLPETFDWKLNTGIKLRLYTSVGLMSTHYLTYGNRAEAKVRSAGDWVTEMSMR